MRICEFANLRIPRRREEEHHFQVKILSLQALTKILPFIRFSWKWPKKTKIEEVEEEEDFLSSNDEKEKPKNDKLKTKQASPRGFRIPKGSVMGAATETAYELSQEHDKDKAATTKKPKKVAASPKAKKTKK